MRLPRPACPKAPHPPVTPLLGRPYRALAPSCQRGLGTGTWIAKGCPMVPGSSRGESSPAAAYGGPASWRCAPFATRWSPGRPPPNTLRSPQNLGDHDRVFRPVEGARRGGPPPGAARGRTGDVPPLGPTAPPTQEFSERRQGPSCPPPEGEGRSVDASLIAPSLVHRVSVLVHPPDMRVHVLPTLF